MAAQVQRRVTEVEPALEAARVRASYLKHVLECVDALPNAAAADIRARLGPALAAIDGATRVDWLPPEVPLALIAAAEEVLGSAGMLRLYRAAMQSSLKGKLLSPLFSAVARMFGLSPERIFRSAPAGFASIWRDAGEIAVESSDPGCVVLHHTGIPVALRSSGFLAATAASFEVIPAECGLPGRSEVSRDGNGARYTIRW
jgi:hypothetical protein